jgi:hypothetical protein
LLCVYATHSSSLPPPIEARSYSKVAGKSSSAGSTAGLARFARGGLPSMDA